MASDGLSEIALEEDRVTEPTVYRTLGGERLAWDEIRETPTTLSTEFIGMHGGGNGFHESLLRSYRILSEVKAMLGRGDSPETVRKFIEWAEAREAKW